MTVTWRTSFYTPVFPASAAIGQSWTDPNTGLAWTYSSTGWQASSTSPTSTNLSISNPGGFTDASFNNVTMLLRMDGTSESQTFVDSGPYNLTISVFGSARILDQNKKSGSGAGFFNGNSSYLTSSVKSVYSFGQNDFTVEGWFYSNSSANNQTLFSIGSFDDGILLRRQTGGDKLYVNGTPYNYDPNLFPIDTWVHVALTRASGQINLWIDGQSCLTATNTSSIAPAGSMAIAASVHTGYQENFAGYIDNFRITANVCRYSGNFSPSDSLSFGNITFDPTRLAPASWWDVSDLATLTLSGSKISEWRDKTTNGRNLSQSENSLRPNYLESQVKTKPVADWGPAQNDIHIGTGNLAEPVVVQEMYCVLKYETNGNQFLNYPGIVNPSSNIGWSTLSVAGAYGGEWVPWEYYINGDNASNRSANLFEEIKDTALLRIKAPSGATPAASNIILGTDRFYTNYGRGWRGYFCEVLLFSSPLSEKNREQLTDYLKSKWAIRRDIHFAYTSLLLHMNGVNGSNSIIDSSDNSLTVTAYGNAVLSTESFRFGCSALSLDGSNSYVATEQDSQLLLGSQDFTVECWAYVSDLNTNNGLFEFGASGLRLYVNNGHWRLAPTNSTGVQIAAVTENTWQHIAISRRLSTVKMFVNGTQIGADLDYSGVSLTGNQLNIGTGAHASSGGSYAIISFSEDWGVTRDFRQFSGSGSVDTFIGKIDEFRVTKGVCRYRDNFVAPSSSFRRG
jgi:hypothetical protein